MTIRTGRTAIICCSVAIAASACSPPLTDVIATSTESVGPYNVVAIAGGDRGFTATVCMADASHASAVSERVIDQLIDHGYVSITLHLVAMSPHGPTAVKQVQWTPQGGVRDIGAAPASNVSACTTPS
jgi:hypothetical protein